MAIAARDEWPLTGRHDDLAALVAAVAQNGLVVIAGEAGVGKTRLAREVLARTTPAGVSPLWVAGSASAHDIPLAPFAPWLAQDAGSATDVTLLQRTIAALRAGGPQSVLGVDDAHLLDGASAAVLAQLAAQRSMRMVVTVRTGEPAPDAVTALWKDAGAQRWELAPLTEADTTTLVETVLGGPMDRATRSRLFSNTRGNALWLRHLVDGERESGRLARTGEMWLWSGAPTITPALRELISARIGQLTEPQTLVLELLAFGEPLGLDLLAGLSGAAAVEEMAERRLVSVGSDGLRSEARLGHPLYGEVVRARLSLPRARRLRGTLADALDATTGRRRTGDGLRLAVLRLDSDQQAEPTLMVDAAIQAMRFGDLDLAERLFRASLDAGGGFDARLGLGNTVGWLMRPTEADVELARAVDAATTDAQRARATLARVSNLYTVLGRMDDAWVVLGEAEQSMELGPARTDLGAGHALMEMASNRLDRAQKFAASVLDAPESSQPAQAWAGWAATARRALAGRGEPLESLARRAIDAAGGSPETVPMQANIGFLEVLGLGLEGRPEPARERARQIRERPGDYSAIFGAVYEARTALDTGQVRTAARLLGGIVPFFPGYGGGWTSWFELMIAQALGAAGDGAGARAAAERARASEHPGLPFLAPERGLADAWVAAADGAHGDAIALARRAAALAATSGQRAMEVLIRHTAVCFGDRSQTAPLAELARVVGGLRAVAAVAHARSFVGKDPVGLLAVSVDLEDAGLLLVAADATAQAAVLHRAQGLLGPASVAADRATALAQRCEGARTPALAATMSVAGVSDRGREIATLVAAGLTNRQIADRLVISVRTVESQIYRACSRLGLVDRAALAAAVVPEAGSEQPTRDAGLQDGRRSEVAGPIDDQ